MHESMIVPTVDQSHLRECEAASPEAVSKPNKQTPAIVAVVASGLAVTGCGGGGSSPATPSAQSGTSPSSIPEVHKPTSDSEAARFLLRASLSASKSSISQLKEQGYEKWLASAFARKNDTSAVEFLTSRGFDQIDDERYFQRSTTADWMIWNQLFAGGNEVRKRVALALSEFFVVSLVDLEIYWPAVAVGSYWDKLNELAFGNFRDLLEVVALHPAMATYLDTIGSKAVDPVSGRAPDENFARELMQLFTIGLVELHDDGSPKTSDGRPIETFNNADVSGLAKCFTGFDYDFSETEISHFPGHPDIPLPGPDFARRPVTADQARWQRPSGKQEHSQDEKTFLGVGIAPGASPEESVKFALDTLFKHPNVGPFFGKQMIQKLVTSNPSPSYVARVTAAFNDNGRGERGDLRAVFQAILLDHEAMSASGVSNPLFGKLREPMLRLVQWGRTFGAGSKSGQWQIDALVRDFDQIGQSPFRSQSVFNFFRPNHTSQNSNAQANDLVAPEFELVNETSVTGYVNFMTTMIEGRSYSSRDVAAQYESELEIAHDARKLLNQIVLLLTADQLSENSRSIILDALEAEPVSQASDEQAKLARIHLAVLLVMASSEYLIQK